MEAKKQIAKKYDALTGLRWFAALAVVFRHNLPPTNSVFYSFFANGYSGVTIFFVLSGFVITFRYLDQFCEPSGRALWNYFVARFARIYPSYFAVLVAVGIVFGVPDFSVVLRHIFVIQTWSGNSDVAYALNGPGWSIGVEFFLYLIFPLLAIWFARKSRNVGWTLTLAFIVVVVLAIVTIYFSSGDRRFLSEIDANSAWRWIYRNPVFRIGDFILGMTVAVLLTARRFMSSSRTLAIGLGSLSIAWILVAMGSARTVGSAASMDLLYAVPTTFLIYSLVVPADHFIRTVLESRVVVWLGEISFAVYLVHVPLGSKLEPFIQSNIEINHWSINLLFVVIGTIIGGSILHYTLERPCQRFLRKLLSVDHQ